MTSLVESATGNICNHRMRVETIFGRLPRRRSLTPRARLFSLSPTTSKRLLRKLYRKKKTLLKTLERGGAPPPAPISFLVRPRVKLTLINLGGAQCLVAINIAINTDNCKVATS